MTAIRISSALLAESIPELREHYNTPRLVFRNLGKGKFEELLGQAGPGVEAAHSSRGCAVGDFDNDGDLDILIINHNEPPSLLRNDVSGNHHWIKVKLHGVKSNRGAVGGRVTVRYGDRVQAQEVLSQSSYLSSNDSRLHFGLGAVGKADLEMRWPSGRGGEIRGCRGRPIGASSPKAPGLRERRSAKMTGVGRSAGRFWPWSGTIAAPAQGAQPKGPVEEAWSLLGKGSAPQAIRLLYEIVKKNPADADARLLLGSILQEEGDARDPSTQLTEAVKLRPRSAEAQNALGEAFHAAGDAKAARGPFEKAVALDPTFAQARCESRAWSCWMPAISIARRLQLDRAIELLGSKPDAAYPHYLRAKVSSAQNEVGKAQRTSAEAVALRPGFRGSMVGSGRRAQDDARRCGRPGGFRARGIAGARTTPWRKRGWVRNTWRKARRTWPRSICRKPRASIPGIRARCTFCSGRCAPMARPRRPMP